MNTIRNGASRKIRNPRYAPEFLERKLSPSSFAPSVAIVQVIPSVEAFDYPPTDPTLPGSPTEPGTNPTLPGGPSGPR